MSTRRWSAVCAWLALPALVAQAQPTEAQALERAQRDADSPLRVIIEAGKIKPKAKTEADAKAESKSDAKVTVDRPAAHAVAAKPPVAAATPVERESSLEATRAAALASVRALSPAVTPQSDAASAPPTQPDSSRASAVDAAPPASAAADAGMAGQGAAATPAPTRQSARSGALPAASASAISAPSDPAKVPAPSGAVNPDGSAPETPQPEAAAAPGPAAVAAAVPGPAAVAAAAETPAARPPGVLELLSAVQPEVPERILGRMRRDGEVLVAFKVNPDGTVSDPNVESSNNAALDDIALEAVRQWRYKPIAQARIHRVQLVFKRE